MDRTDIKRAALFRFAEQGYHATTVRHLAIDLRVTPAAFYYHFKSKDELLTAMIEEILTDDLEVLQSIRLENKTNPFDELLYMHVYFMCAAHEEGLIVLREAKYLKKDFRERVARMFHEYEAVFSACIAEEYDLSGEELRLATRAVVGLGASVLQWYHQGGPLSGDDVARAFVRYARGILERAERDAGPGTSSGRRRSDGSLNGSGPLSFDDKVALVSERVALRRGITHPARAAPAASAR